MLKLFKIFSLFLLINTICFSIIADWQNIENQVNNAIIQIFAQKTEFNWQEPYKAPLAYEVTGTGFFINDEGDFLTNYHVVSQAKSILFSIPSLGQKNLQALFIGACPELDVALFKLTEESRKYILDNFGEISFLNFGNSERLYRTQPILAVGFPMGFKSTKYTLGNVAGIDYVSGSSFIHVTSPINIGNSGGPSINKNGEVIGINTAYIKDARNIGYATPINNIKKILSYLYTEKYYRRPSLGIYVSPGNDAQAESLNNPVPCGVYIYYVEKNSVADKAGIKKGDMLYEIKTKKFDYTVNFDGKVEVDWGISNKVSIIEFLQGCKFGKKLTFVVWRNGERKEFDCAFEAAPKHPIRYIFPELEPEEIDYEMFAGACFMQLRINHFKYLPKTTLLKKLSDYKNQDTEAVIITTILPGSQIDKLNTLYSGCVIDKINNIKIKNLKDLRQAIKLSAESKKILITTKDDIFSALSLDKVLQDESRLANNFMFPISSTIKELMEK